MDSDEDDSRRSSDGPHSGPADPAVGAEAIARVRADLARLGADPDAAPEVPAAITARIGAALRAAPPPTSRARPAAVHAARPRRPPVRRFSMVIGICAALLAAGLGLLMLVHHRSSPPPAPSTPPAEMTANTITVRR